MAQFEIGKITIIQAHNGHSVGDAYTSYFDDSTLNIVVKDETGTVVDTAPGVYNINNIVFPIINYLRANTGLSYYQTNERIVFDDIEAFPYYSQRVIPVVGGGVDDLSFSVTTTNPSVGGSDGVILIVASGTNTPFQYSKDGGINYQNTASFSGLLKGQYSISVKDSLGFTRSQTVVLVDEVDIGTGVRWRFYYAESHPNGSARDNVKHRVDIVEADYSGSITEIKPTYAALQISSRAEGNQPGVDITAMTVEAKVSIVAQTFQQFHDIATGADFKHKILHYIDDAGDESAYTLRGQYWVSPETYVEEYGDTPYTVQFSGTDRMADLSSIEYRPSEGGKYSGLTTELQVIKNCLKETRLQQNFRIALNIYETSMSTTNTSPLHQAYVLQDVYYDSKGKPMSCGEVLRAILQPYGAFIVSWEGFWYIIREELLKDTSVSYNQFDWDTLSYSSGSSWSPRITYKSGTGQTNYYTYLGPQGLSFTRPVKSINVTADLVKSESGLLNGFVSSNMKNPRQTFNFFDPFDFTGGNTLTIDGFNGWEIVQNNSLYQRYNEGGWEITLLDELPSNTYLRASNVLSYISQDSLDISFKVKVNFNIGGIYIGISPGTPVAYMILKWKLKLGSNYLQVDGTWTTTDTTNQFFIEKEEANKFVDFNIKAPFPADVNEVTEETYEFTVYPVSAWEYDGEYASKAALITAMQTLADSSSYTSGSRRIVRYSSGGYYYYLYYELVIEEDASNDGLRRIKASIASDRYWELLYTWYEQVNTGGILAGRTRTTFKDISFITLPNGEEAPDEYVLKEDIGTGDSQKDLDINLFHFDLPDTINNDEKLYLNFTRLSDGSPTTVWTKTGGVTEKLRQDHLLDRLYELYKRPRYQMSANFYSDAELSPIKVLYDATDFTRIFIMNGVDINYTSGQHSGDILEIFSSETPTRGDYNNDYDTDNDYF